MCDFVDYDLGDTEAENEPESDDMFDNEPPAKRPRGANLKYDYVGEIIKNEILELANHTFENHFDIAGAAFICVHKNYGNPEISVKAHDLKRVTKVISSGGNYYILLIQVICNDRQWPNMPALRQTINVTARNRRGRPRGHTQALLH